MQNDSTIKLVLPNITRMYFVDINMYSSSSGNITQSMQPKHLINQYKITKYLKRIWLDEVGDNEALGSFAFNAKG